MLAELKKLKNKLSNFSCLRFLYFLYEQFFKDNCQQRAASLTYTTLLAVIPFITVVIAIVSSSPALESSRQQIYQLLYSYLLPDSGLQITPYIENFSQQSSHLTTIGMSGLFFTSIMMLITVETSFNQIWQVKKQTYWIRSMLRYWVLLTLGPLLLSVVFTASTAIRSIQIINQQVSGIAVTGSIWIDILSYIVTVIGFFCLYVFVPRTTIPIRNATVAALIVAMLFELLKHTFGLLIDNFTSYEMIYGAFAVLPIFLVWVYVSWILVLLGVEISFCLTMFSKRTKQPQPKFYILLKLLQALSDGQKQGVAVNQKVLRSIIYSQECTSDFNYLPELIEKGFIVQTTNNEFVLMRNIDDMSIWELYQSLPYDLPVKLFEESDTKTTEDNNKLKQQFADFGQADKIDELFKSIAKTSKEVLDIPLSKILEVKDAKDKA